MLDKAIEHGKEHRKQYRKSNLFDRSCRNHGGCPYCESNRLWNYKKRKKIANKEIVEASRFEFEETD